ncbi:MAG TPA: hypothetical protein VJQ54_20975 [Candidatus Sulfotelmatobacter sp.]|nr:hypothetical protein [Candidatus Sulfotelmatobacter sp.]
MPWLCNVPIVFRGPVAGMRPNVPQLVKCAERDQDERNHGTKEHHREQHASPPEPVVPGRWLTASGYSQIGNAAVRMITEFPVLISNSG